MNVAVLINLNRDRLAVLISGRNLGVIVLVIDLDTSVLLLISRLNGVHIGIINRSRLLLRVVVVTILLVVLDRDIDLDLALRQIRILNSHRDRTINILTRSHVNVAVLINLNRDRLAVLIGGRNLGVAVLVIDLDTSVLLLISRLDRLDVGIINRSRIIFGDLQGHLVGVALTDNLLSRVTIGIDRLLCPVVGDRDVVLHVVGSFDSGFTRDLAILESQALRKASDLDVGRGHALWQALDLLRNINRIIVLINNAVDQRCICNGDR